MSDPMIEIVRRALGRTTPLQSACPNPPEIPDSIARLSSRDGDIAQRFAKTAADAKFLLEQALSRRASRKAHRFPALPSTAAKKIWHLRLTPL